MFRFNRSTIDKFDFPTYTLLNTREGRSMESEVFEFKSAGKYIISVDEFGVSIQQKGLMNAMAVGMTGTKQIPFTSMTAVQFRPAGLLSGYLQFSVLGGNEARGGVFQAAGDENTIMFTKKEQDKAEQIKGLVEGKIRQSQVSKSAPVQMVKSAAEQIKEFKELLDMGAISQEEFDLKKSQLLG
jgi:hypothetical protein